MHEVFFPLKSELGNMQPCSELRSSTTPRMRCSGVFRLRSYVRIRAPFSMCMQRWYLNFWGQFLSLLLIPVLYEILLVYLVALADVNMYILAEPQWRGYIMVIACMFVAGTKHWHWTCTQCPERYSLDLVNLKPRIGFSWTSECIFPRNEDCGFCPWKWSCSTKELLHG